MLLKEKIRHFFSLHTIIISKHDHLHIQRPYVTTSGPQVSVCIISSTANTTKFKQIFPDKVRREKTNKIQQLDVHYQLPSQHVSGIFRRTKALLLHLVCCSGSAGCGW